MFICPTRSARERLRPASLLLLLALLTIATAAAAPSRAESPTTPVDLVGTWFVLIHYSDEKTANPDATRWLDRVWTFEQRGSRLHWTEYPIVVVSDTTGRFEAIRGNPRSRVLAGWEPNDGQLEEIRNGPRVNQRGSKTKSLRRTKQGDWASMDGGPAVRSASVVGYQEHWRIDDAGALPRFSITDTVGGGTMKAATGGSHYEVAEITKGGAELRGKYTRDEVKKGSFRMLRTQPIRDLETADDARTPNERAAERAKQEWLKRNSPQDPDGEPGE